MDSYSYYEQNGMSGERDPLDSGDGNPPESRESGSPWQKPSPQYPECADCKRFCRGIVIGGILGLAMWLGIILLGIHLVHWMERL